MLPIMLPITTSTSAPLLRLTADSTCPARRRSLLDVASAKHWNWNRNPFRHFKWVLQLQSGRCQHLTAMYMQPSASVLPLLCTHCCCCAT